MGPLSEVRIVEFAGPGPAPFGAMMLAELGADILRIDRPGSYPAPDATLAFEKFGKFVLATRPAEQLRGVHGRAPHREFSFRPAERRAYVVAEAIQQASLAIRPLLVQDREI